MEWTKQTYNKQYENWMPWVEDKYLSYFTSDNKASYATKDTLDQTKVTGVEPVDKLQDGVNGIVGGQVGKGGLFQGVGDMASKEGVNRAERGGKDDSGSYMGSLTGGASKDQEQQTGSYMGSAASGMSSAASGAAGYGKGAASSVGGYFSGGSKGEEQKGEQESKK